MSYSSALSAEQLAFAKQRLKNQNLTKKAHLHLTDYRQQQGQFDHIVSIEMFEAVGKEYWDNYFIWYYYLEYCRVGFDTLCTDVLQLTLTHKKTWCKNND